MPKTTFLNVEAVAVELNPRPTRSRKLYESGFFEGVATETIEINLEENPFPDLCVARSLLTAALAVVDLVDQRPTVTHICRYCHGSFDPLHFHANLGACHGCAELHLHVAP